MKNREVSLRGKLVRDMMKNMMDSAMGHKIQTGEYRMDPKEPAWICPPDYEYEIVGMEHFKMEYLRPAGAFYFLRAHHPLTRNRHAPPFAEYITSY